jgi:hypothetical protein
MSSRRNFMAAALAVSVATRVRATDDPQGEDSGMLERLSSGYARCKFYADISRISAKAMLMTAPSETRIAFAAPGRLCVQEATRGNILTVSIIDVDRSWAWSSGKDWRGLYGADSVMAGIHGSGKLLGDSTLWIAAMLMKLKFPESDYAPQLAEVRCTSTTPACESFEGRNGKSQLSVTLDAKTGLIRRMVTDNALIHSTADVESIVDSAFDMSRMIESVRSHPDRPMNLKDLRAIRS